MNFSPGSLLMNNKTRILDVFEKWLNELDTIQHIDFQRAAVCLLHIGRMLEDASLVPATSANLVMDEEEDRFEITLSRILLEDYSEVAYNAFRNMITTADINYQNACLRMLITLNLTSRDIGELFSEVFPPNELEDFVKEQINHPNELFRSRVSFLMGEMLSDETSIPEIPIDSILLPRIRRIKDIRAILQGREADIIDTMAQVDEYSKYTTDSTIPIPDPDSPTPDTSFWGIDEGAIPDSTLYYITVLNGFLHLTASIIEITDALAIAVSESLMKECIEILKLPAVPIKTFTLILIGNASLHRKLAMDFVELDGPTEIYKVIDSYRNGDKKDFEGFCSHATYIMSNIFKHSSAVDLFVKPSNANQIVSFMFSLFNDWDNLGTNLNILQWCSEAIHHPLLLRSLHSSNVWRKVKSICDALLRMKTSAERKKDSMFFVEYSRAVITLCLKYIVAHMFWGYQYSKSLFSDMDDLKPLSKSFGSLIRKNYVGRAGTVDIVQALVSSPAVIKIDDAEMYALEAYVFKSLIRTGHLPKGMTLDLFGGEGYGSTHSHQFLSSSFPISSSNNYSSESANASINNFSGFGQESTLTGMQPARYQDNDTEAQSVLSMVTKVLPEWTVVEACIRENVISALFQIIMMEIKDSTTVCMGLLCLQLLAVDAAAIVEIMQYDITKEIDSQIVQENAELNGFQNKKGLEILLYLLSNQERRDPSVMVSVLRLLAAMSAAPYFRYNGNDSSVARNFYEDYLKSPYFAAVQQLTADKKKPFDTAKKQILSKLAYNPLENVQRSVRKSVRANAGISMLTQMLYYKKNMTYTMSIRLETIKVLLGLQQDDDIRQILVKLRLPTVLENQIQAEKSQSNMFDLHTIPQKFQDKALLQFYTDNLVNLLRGVAMHHHHIGQESNGLSILDDAQEHLMRKQIVDHSNIDFSQFELLYLIRDHLSAMGLTKSATTLEAELIEREHHYNHQHKSAVRSSKSPFTTVNSASTTDIHLKHHSTLSHASSIEQRLNVLHLPPSDSNPNKSQDTIEDDIESESHGVSSLSGSKKRLREQPVAAGRLSLDIRSQEPEMDEVVMESLVSQPVSTGKRLSVAFAAVANKGIEETKIGVQEEHEDDAEISPPPLKYSTCAKKAAMAHQNNNSHSVTSSSSTNLSATKRPPPSTASSNTVSTTVPHRIIPPILPIAKSQRRKNIVRALGSDSCTYITGSHTAAVSRRSSNQNSDSVGPTSPRVASATSAAPISSSSNSIFVTPNSNRYSHHPHNSQSSRSSSGRASAPVSHHHSHSNATVISDTTCSGTTMTFASTQSKLSSIMRRYLRLQHSQCKHPISTLPTMSLLKPHSCAKPPPVPFFNINHIVQRYQPNSTNAHWMQQYRHDVYAGRLHHLYSSYRTILTEEEDGFMISACAFGQQSHRLWLARYNYDNGPDVTMINAQTQNVMSEAYDLELPGMIESFVFPDMHYASHSLPNLAQPHQPVLATMVQSHMMTNGQALGKEVYLYRDRDSAEVFESPALHKLAITQDDLRHIFSSSQPGYTVPSTIVDDDLCCFDSVAFSRGNGRYVATSISNDLIPMAAGIVFDIETGIVIHRLLNEASSGGDSTYEFPQLQYMPEEDNMVLFDGKLYDLRTNQVLHRFDKLSRNGNAVFHPSGFDVIIDSAIWDLRMFSLRQTVPLLENCRVQFDRFGGGIIAAMSMKDDDRLFSDIREEYLGFHVLHPVDYSHIHTHNVVKAGQVSGFALAEVQVDRNGCGLIAGILLAGAQEATVSQCKILEIGLRKRTADDDANDMDDDSDDDDDWHGSMNSDESDSSGTEDDEEDDGSIDEEDESDDSDNGDDDDDDDDDGDSRDSAIDNDDADRNDAAEDDEDDEDDEDWETDEGENDEEHSDGYETVSDGDDDDDDDEDEEEDEEDAALAAGSRRSNARNNGRLQLPTRRGPYSRR